MTQTKICTKCKQKKLLTEFRKDKTKPLGVYSSCKNCCSKILTKNQKYIQELKNTIEFVPIKNFENIYSISRCGRIISEKEFKIKSIHLSQSGYPSVIFCVNNKATHHSIHRLIAETYIPNVSNRKRKVINEYGEIFESITEASKSLGKQCLAVSCAIRHA